MLYFVAAPRALWVRSAVAGAVLACVSVAHAADDKSADSLGAVVVTATRSPQDLQQAPIGASVITADMLAASGVTDVNQAIRKLGGVAARTDLGNGREYTLDLRGYGSTADQNLVVMVDGIRMSENELTSARLSAIALSQVERIEIVRGGSSVMWGEGASAGVINIITKNHAGQADRAQVSAAIESFGGVELQASGQRSWGAHSLDASVKRVNSDGYRDNGASHQTAASFGYQWSDADWQVKWRTQSEDQSARLPGALTFAQFESNPQQTSKPNDYAETQEWLHSLHVSRQWGGLTLAMDAGLKNRDSVSHYVGYDSNTRRESRQWSPYLTHATQWLGSQVTNTVGAQWQDWQFRDVNTFGSERANQKNRATYIRSDWQLPTATRVSLGWREERVRKSSDVPYDRRDQLHARELGISQTVAPQWDVYGRVAQSYRLANVDENRYLSQPLLPQINRDKELGVKWQGQGRSATLRWFKQRTHDEIAYDPTANTYGANVNLAPTQRQGFELEGHWQVSKPLQISGTWQQVKARFSAGPQTGREMTLVAPHTATLRASYQVNVQQTAELGMQYRSAMRFGGDASNSCTNQIPSATVFDARYAVMASNWELSMNITNLTDRKTYSYAYSCSVGSLYPDASRAFRLQLTRSF